MSKQTKDLVAAAHQAFAMDEISLKQLAIATSELKENFEVGTGFAAAAGLRSS